MPWFSDIGISCQAISRIGRRRSLPSGSDAFAILDDHGLVQRFKASLKRGTASDCKPSLGSHVAVLGDTTLFVLAGEAEVEDPRTSVVADDRVVRLEVAVDDSLGMGGSEPSAGLHEHVDDYILVLLKHKSLTYLLDDFF